LIWQALRSKFEQRGALGFAADAFELAVASGVNATWSGLCVAGALTVLFVGAPFAAWELLARAPAGECRCVTSFDECRCGREGRRP
jgi:hypothetical protein